jgi:hypothetical protein
LLKKWTHTRHTHTHTHTHTLPTSQKNPGAFDDVAHNDTDEKDVVDGAQGGEKEEEEEGEEEEEEEEKTLASCIPAGMCVRATAPKKFEQNLVDEVFVLRWAEYGFPYPLLSPA